MSVNAVDCTGLSPAQIAILVKNGVKTVGRYLTYSTWKGLNVGEVANLKAAGLQIFSIFESNPTNASYFSADKGKSDALDAIALAKTVGQPEGTAIYFTVDYDAQAATFPAILAYFQAVKANLSGYKVGAYGSYTVLNYLHQNNAADYWFQTIAWSNGQHCSFLNIYQFQCDKVLGGVSVDFDNCEKADIGAWGQEMVRMNTQPATPVKNGWLKENNIWHFYKNGVLVKNDWAKDSKGLWYYLSGDGSMATNQWVKWKNVWYFLKEDGSMAASDWVKWKDKWYYVKADGSMATGVIEDKGKLYYLQSDGSMLASGRVNVSLNVTSDGSLHP